MARKNVLAPILLQTHSLAASFSSIYSNIQFDDNASYQLVVTAAGSSGQFYLDGSDDVLTNVITAPANWTEIMSCGTVAGANDSILIDINQWPHGYIRLRYVSAVAGAGSVSINLTAKQLGG